MADTSFILYMKTKEKKGFDYMTKEYAIAYLSQNFKGIGPKKAEKIIAITGPDLIEYFKGNNYEGLYKILKSEKVEELRKRILTDSQNLYLIIIFADASQTSMSQRGA